jgi:hypothetical protein
MSKDRVVLTIRAGVRVSSTDVEMLSERARSQVQALCDGLALPVEPVIMPDPDGPWLSIEDRVVYGDSPFGPSNTEDPTMLADAVAWSILQARTNLVTDEVARLLESTYLGEDHLRSRLAELMQWGFGAQRLPRANGQEPASNIQWSSPSAFDANLVEIHISGNASREEKGQPDWAVEVQSEAFNDWGLAIPPPRIIDDPLVPPDQIRLQVNDLMCPALRKLEPRDTLVLADPQECLSADPEVRPWMAWALGGPYSIINNDRVQFLAPTLAAVPAIHAIATLVVRRWGAYLLSQDGIAFRLAGLSRQFPSLARAVASIPVDRLVEIARYLLTHGESIYDFRNIVQTLLLLGDRTPVNPISETIVRPPAHLPRPEAETMPITAEEANSEAESGAAQDAAAVSTWFHNYVVLKQSNGRPGEPNDQPGRVAII